MSTEITKLALEITKLRKARSELYRKYGELGSAIDNKVEELLRVLDDASLKSCDDKRAGKIVTTLQVRPIIEDQQTFCKYIRRHNAFELLEMRPHMSACNERIEKSRGRGIPGIGTIEKRNVRITAPKK